MKGNDARAELEALIDSLQRLEDLTHHVQPASLAVWAMSEIVEYFTAERQDQDAELADLVVVCLGYLDKAGKLQLALPMPGTLLAVDSIPNIKEVTVKVLFYLVRGDWRKAYKGLPEEDKYYALVKECIWFLCNNTSIFSHKAKFDATRPNRPFYSDGQGRLHISE